MTPKARPSTTGYDQLSQAALARVDDKGRSERDSHLKNVAESEQLGLQGGYSAQQRLSDAATADQVVRDLANQNQPILNIYGEPVKAGSDPLIAFNATPEQRANSLLLNTPTAEAERQRIAIENSEALNYLRAQSGGATPLYPLEEQLLGAGIGGKAISAVARAVERVAAAKATAAEIEAARISNNVYRDADGFAQVAQREFQPGTSFRAENINAGQAVDRDGLPRVGEEKSLSEAQLREQLGKNPDYWGTANPSWKEGTVVTDRVTTEPEIYRMVIDKRQYDNIQEALANDDFEEAAKQLGGWATKDPVGSMRDVRRNLAITNEFKPTSSGQTLYTVEFEVKPGVGLREGTVGPMWDPVTQRLLPGGGSQVDFMTGTVRTNPGNFVVDPNSTRPLR